MRKFAFVSNILRLLRDEIQYELERFPPKRPITKFNSFALNDLPGEQWIKLTRKFGEIEDIKVDSKIFHGSIPVSKLFIQEKDNHDGHKVESSVSNYDNAYKKLDNLDFMTAAKILFTDPPKKKKFGIDFHLVQLFFACMPSLAVYLVAQYARYEMRRMEAELEQKKELEDKKRQEEEEKAKELELREVEEKIKSNPELVEVTKRLGKLEEAVNEIVVESKKQSRGVIVKTLDHGDEKKHPTKSEPANTQSK